MGAHRASGDIPMDFINTIKSLEIMLHELYNIISYGK